MKMIKKDTSNSMVCGVCSGLADSISVDPVIVRAIFAILAVMGMGTPIVIYIILAIIMPDK